MRVRSVLVLVTAAAVGLSGCSSAIPGQASAASDLASAINSAASTTPTDPGTTEPSSAASSTSESESTTSSAEREPLTREIGKTGWYDGFAITVDEATASESFGGVDLEVSYTLENLGTDVGFPPRPSIQIDGNAQDGFFDAPSEVPAGGRSEGTATLFVSEDEDAPLDFDEAMDRVVWVYGDAEDNQTLIPFDESEDVTSIEPRDLEVTGTLTQGQIITEVRSGRLSPSYESGDKDVFNIDLSIKITCAADCSPSGWYIDRSDFSLTGPDGLSNTPDDRLSGFCCEALYPDTISDDERNVLTFQVDAPATGDFTLTLNNASTADAGVAPATFAFSIS
jgi:hypothetical protein